MLKSLELFGFKSFADRTLFEFSPGITCVVGPNGSGKSNVVDALKWILGDQSAKSLRGKEMSDVIFNGSSGRRGSGFAEASLTFDNSEGLLPVDSPEMKVGRRLYQSGDSEYLLNQVPVRLKDIRDLFLGTGAGTAAYSIIEQGRVDQILQSNPTARRVVFEEAAGISKFKSRKIDAERRLERVAQNLLRLTDIVDEVDSQLTSARSQASKAARYRELTEELKTLWTGLAADDLRMISLQIHAKQEDLDQLEQDLHNSQEKLQQIEAEKRRTEAEITECDGNLIEHEREMAGYRERITRSRSEIDHQSSRITEFQERIDKLRTKRAQLSARSTQLALEFKKSEQRHEEFRQRFDREQDLLKATKRRLKEHREQIAASENTIEDLNGRQSKLENGRSAASERAVMLNAQLEELAGSQRMLQSDLARFETDYELAETRLEQNRQSCQLVEQEVLSQQETVIAIQGDVDKLIEQQRFTNDQLVEIRQRKSADFARLTILEELEQRQAGIAIGVQDILDRARSAHYPPWNCVLGLVRDLIDVPLELAPIIDAALGERAQWIALSDVKPMIHYLNLGAAPIDGRIGFVGIPTEDSRQSSPPLPSSIHKSDQHDELDLTGQQGVYGRADRLIEERAKVRGLSRALLADTWIVESLSDAQRLSSESHGDVRFVTLQGEVLTNQQELIVGQAPHESSLVSRKSEVRQLRIEIHHCERGIEDLTQRQALFEESLLAKQSELTEARKGLDAASKRLTENETRLAGQEAELVRLQGERNGIQDQLSKLERRSTQVREEIQQNSEENERCQTELNGIQQKLQSLTDELASQRARLDEEQQQIESQQLAIAKAEERFSSLRSERNRAEKELIELHKTLEEFSSQILDLTQARNRAELSVLCAQDIIATQTLALESTIQSTRQDFLKRNQLRSARTELSSEEESGHAQRRKIQDRQHQIEISLQQLQHQLTSTADRIFEEFQISAEELISGGVSAYRIYLSERYGDEVADLVVSAQDASPELIDDSEPVASVDSQESEEPVEAVSVPEFEEVREELDARVDRLRRKVKTLGHVNPDALHSLDELEARYQTLSHQLMDLEQAKSALEEIIRTINKESQRIFLETFETIRGHFQELFRKLFGGGDADIILEDPENVLDCGIDIVARPPGKELRSISLLSGGEKTMTAVALLFAMFKSKPSPYCILDEVDAALDEANVDRYVSVLKEFVSTTQFIVITHRKRTMTAADILYGVTMEQAGISKRIAVNFEEVNDQGEISSAA